MDKRIIQVADGFWNIRGSFKVGGLIDVGTHASLVRRENGKYVFLDSYTLGDAEKRHIDEITHGGRDVEAIINVHPFHTVHVRAMHALYPHARLYGTSRHLSRFPDLPWEQTLIEDPAAHEMFEGDFDLSVPRGVDLVSANENVHFSSVLVLHRASRTIHVDDTLMYLRLPSPMRLLGVHDMLRFSPMLAQALEKRPGAARDFRRWAEELALRSHDAENLCAAHTTTLTARENGGAPIKDRILKALEKADRTLKAHERKYG
ncbi:hypothetical protein WMF04_46290 [Sorangium sp. So ce260]|uniref:hypothetical protein n=1 Tax=Sorangium sp. So ce260 TaxID=3133291 RepID=UPI003F614A84